MGHSAPRPRMPSPGTADGENGGGWENQSPGDVLLFHAVASAVPSALKGLTSVFGMGTGVAPSLWPPGTEYYHNSIKRNSEVQARFRILRTAGSRPGRSSFLRRERRPWGP